MVEERKQKGKVRGEDYRKGRKGMEGSIGASEIKCEARVCRVASLHLLIDMD